jgi:CRISPR-associated protein Csm2
LNWEQRSRQLSDSDFTAQLPLIHMIIAKVAYAKARNHVTDKYEQLIRECISAVKTRAELRNCKLFFEAFMGFYKGLYEQQKEAAKTASRRH